MSRTPDGSAGYSAGADRSPKVFVLRNLAKRQRDKVAADDGGSTRQVPHPPMGRANTLVAIGDTWEQP